MIISVFLQSEQFIRPVFLGDHDDVIIWKHFRATGPLWGEFTGHRWIPITNASDAELWCFLRSALNKQLSKQSWGWWFETPSRSLWRQDLLSLFAIRSYFTVRKQIGGLLVVCQIIHLCDMFHTSNKYIDVTKQLETSYIIRKSHKQKLFLCQRKVTTYKKILSV